MVLRLLRQIVPPGGSVLDVGAGVDPLVPMLHRRDFKVTTVDPGPEVPPSHFSAGVFEASTGHMPKDFSQTLNFEPVGGTESDPGDRREEQALPVILATPDRQYAIRVYSPDLPRNGLSYGRLTFPDVVKWNCVFREKDVEPGAYTY